MTLAWLVMLPLGLINVAAVACWMEYGPRLADRFHLPRSPTAVLFGCSVLAVAWLIATLSIPSAADNRPRRGPIPPSFIPYAGSSDAFRKRNIAFRPRRLKGRGDSPAMKPDDKNIRWVEPPRLGLLGKSYLLLFVHGLTTTLRHLFRRKLTVQSPEARHAIVDPLAIAACTGSIATNKAG